jgi:hypothetical protein
VSIDKRMHLTVEDLGAPRRAARETRIAAEPQGFTKHQRELLIEGVGGALAIQRAEYEAVIAALESKINRLELAGSMGAELERRLAMVEGRTMVADISAMRSHAPDVERRVGTSHRGRH